MELRGVCTGWLTCRIPTGRIRSSVAIAVGEGMVRSRSLIKVALYSYVPIVLGLSATCNDDISWQTPIDSVSFGMYNGRIEFRRLYKSSSLFAMMFNKTIDSRALSRVRCCSHRMT